MFMIYSSPAGAATLPIAAVAVLALAAAPVAAPLRPDPKLTPGAVDAGAGVATICARGYAGRARHVDAAEKARVFAEYGVDRRRQHFEVDHLISLELGGSNALGNLWPQSYDTRPLNARVKDALEDRLHALVCAGRVPLAVAQAAIARDWVGAYARWVGAPP